MTPERKDDYSHVDERIAREILRLAEVQLQALMAFTIAANQRAATLCGMFITVCIATLGASAAAVEKHPEATWAGLLVAIMLFCAAIQCILALWPSQFHIPGIDPIHWMSDEALNGSLSDTLCHESWNYQGYIEHNRKVNETAARHLKMGVILGCAAPATGAALWALLYFLGCGV